MRVLLVDNHDSYTYNLFQQLAAAYGQEPDVVTNDDARWADLDPADYDAAVISPGPGRPGRDGDFGHSAAVFRDRRIPVLGVCLGHQGLGEAAGARVVAAPRPRHGHLETITHTGDDLFAGIPAGFTAVRYHSLCLAEPLPAELRVLARAEDGVVMAVRHRELPWWGVQFHPESVASEHGARLVDNFRALALAARARPQSPALPHRLRAAVPAGHRPAAAPVPLRIRTAVIDREIDTEAAFTHLYQGRDPAFWLDSARVEPGLSRFSFLGDASGPLGELLRYDVGDGKVTIRRGRSADEFRPGTIFDVLTERLRERAVDAPDTLPFDFLGGYVGYLGYELKGDCGAGNRHHAPEPDAQWLFCDRFLAVDHLEGRTYAVALCHPHDVHETDAWLSATTRVLDTLPSAGDAAGAAGPAARADRGTRVDTRRAAAAERSGGKRRYLANIAECQRLLAAGESYEICLTTTLSTPAPEDPFTHYRRLRALNPAPYGALLRLGPMSVLGASPERFLRVDRHRTAESKPIKGTTPRSPDPVEDEALRRALVTDPKTRAENLMIVDLLRNDLGRVCDVGSVRVSDFLATESYATVHQLVSTIRGTLRPEIDAVGCARACFPGGSMTGAPKLRTLAIIDALEAGPRGVYSGALGYFSASGTADLSIVIRTAVLRDGTATTGAGGAIVLDSDPDAEHAEMLLKAAATLQALAPTPTPSPAPAPAPATPDRPEDRP
ncbi:aminodeoxychorismate synthase component I [Embleya sp. NBC_00896]|uniref:aminodeoxychorismate synthase component I n=1 Tax=Embleya sp. NBC_00896 TaxID=2975961 RepID=UPI002F90784E|nr:aminodeoxychorismate synthase component I [Embleya sp. NBC_00896]